MTRNIDYPFHIDARGRTAYIHQGQYRSAAELERDIDRYLIDEEGA